MKKQKFYITTAIDYVNAQPHVGHAYEKIIADVLARWHRLKGEDVFFLTGTDENAQKNQQAARDAYVDVKDFVKKNSAAFQKLCDTLSISYTDFIRTTEKRHITVSQNIFELLAKKGDIYKGMYEGLYCSGCEAYLVEKDLIENKCPEHNKEPAWIKQESYFFKMGKYQSHVLKLLKSKTFIFPQERCNEIIQRIETDWLKDLCVSRYGADWGIEVPFDQKHRIYVWIDALVNYISALDYPNGKKYMRYWPADIHVIGKGINWFHSVIWTSILFSIGIAQPKKVLVHGYLTVNGKKISKSLGTTIDPVQLVRTYGVDPLRYFLLREIPLSRDGDFSETALKDRLNNELANDLGNLLSRTLTLVEKYCDNKVPVGNNEIPFSLQVIEEHIAQLNLTAALVEIWKYVQQVNKYINDKKPWEAKEKNIILYTALDSLRILAILLSPFIPGTAEKIHAQLGVKPGMLKDAKPNLLKAGTTIKKEGILFTKIP